jgi:hypothetical protein
MVPNFISEFGKIVFGQATLNLNTLSKLQNLTKTKSSGMRPSVRPFVALKTIVIRVESPQNKLAQSKLQI